MSAQDANHELMVLLAAVVEEMIRRRLPFVDATGKVNLRSGALSGTLPAGSGGTGNASGEATPRDGSVTDAKVAADAAIALSKLAGLDERIMDVVGALLVAGSGITIAYNDAGDTLTVAASVVPATTYWEPVTNGDPAYPEIMFDDDGEVLMEEVAL